MINTNVRSQQRELIQSFRQDYNQLIDKDFQAVFAPGGCGGAGVGGKKRGPPEIQNSGQPRHRPPPPLFLLFPANKICASPFTVCRVFRLKGRSLHKDTYPYSAQVSMTRKSPSKTIEPRNSRQSKKENMQDTCVHVYIYINVCVRDIIYASIGRKDQMVAITIFAVIYDSGGIVNFTHLFCFLLTFQLYPSNAFCTLFHVLSQVLRVHHCIYKGAKSPRTTLIYNN